MCCHAWASAAAAADELVTWFTGWEWPWKAVGHVDRAWLNLGPTLLFLGLMSAEGHLKLALAVPGSPWAGPYDPVTAP